MSDAWLRCKIFKGIFSDEASIEVSPTQGNSFAIAVPLSAVRVSSAQGESNQTGTVRVQVFREGNTSWAVLPSDDRPVVSVNEADLS